MKDPLQTEQTPDEVLGVKPGASKAEIDRAWIQAAGRGVAANEAKTARDMMEGCPVDCAKFALLRYDPQALRGLAPCPLDDPSVLLPTHRARTAEAWESHLRQDFPNLGIAHSLAVLWYWWTMYEEERLVGLMEAAKNDATYRLHDLSKPVLLRQACRARGLTCAPNSRACSQAECPWRDDCRSSAPLLPEMWERVIAYWAMLAAGPFFQSGIVGLSAPDADALRKQFIQSLRDRLLDRAQYYSEQVAAGGGRAAPASIRPDPGGRLQGYALVGEDSGPAEAPLAERYRELVLTFSSELETAKALAAARMQTKHGTLACGRLLLGHMGKLAAVRARVKEAVARHPNRPSLRKLRDTLSEYAPVVILLNQRKAEEALEEIGRLPADVQETTEVQVLRARALHLFALQKAGVGVTLEALYLWKLAFQCTRPKSLDAEIRAQIAAICDARAVALQNNRRDEAIDLLEKALGLVRDRNLQSRLAELLTQRAVERFNEGLQQAAGDTQEINAVIQEANRANEREDWDAAIARLRDALASAEKTLEALNREERAAWAQKSPEELAAESRSVAMEEQAMAWVDGESAGKPTKVEEPARKAVVAAADPPTGLRLCGAAMADLHLAARLGSDRAAKQLQSARDNLARSKQGLVEPLKKNLAVLLANRAIAKANSIVNGLNALQKAQSSGAESLSYEESEALGRLAEKGGTFSCALWNAVNDLEEAQRLDPSNDHIRTNLQSCRDLL